MYQEGRDAFRSSVPHLRKDSVDVPSLAESMYDDGGEDNEVVERLPSAVDGVFGWRRQRRSSTLEGGM